MLINDHFILEVGGRRENFLLIYFSGKIGCGPTAAKKRVE